MVDFLMIATRSTKRGVIEIYPKFTIRNHKDLMIRGGDFYAVWLEDIGLWSTDEQDAIRIIDSELDKYAEANKHRFDSDIRVLHMWDAETGMIDVWHKYCQRQLRDSFHMLDEKLIFANTITTKKDYASKKLNYPLVKGKTTAFDKLLSTLYSDEERHKIEWAIGAVVSGESTTLQKFMVLYGAAGTGKSTVLNIIQALFEGYYAVFDAKALGSSSNSFALEAFKTNPLIAIQHDGDLSRIEDNTRLNSLVSHELMTVNEKFKSTYSNRFKCFLFMGTNNPVKITDAKSGLIRRLIDVSPSGDKLDQKEYTKVTKQIDFELGAIAYKCQQVFLDNPSYYDNYIPISMMGASNDFYNYMVDSFHVFKKENGTTLKAAWEMYKNYCEDAKVLYPHSQRVFKEELKTYFREYKERFNLDDGTRVRSYYEGFRIDKFENTQQPVKEVPDSNLIDFDSDESIFDKEYSNCLAQYATANETPYTKWDDVKTTLSEITTSKLHYVKLPENHIVIDFDIKDNTGNKNFEKNLVEASKWPTTYSEISKGGAGIHLHYIYDGDVSKLSRVYDDNIEIKVFTGKSSLRRKLSKCKNTAIATINSGLPLKGEDMINFDGYKSEKGLRTSIKKNLAKEIHPGTKPSMDFIHKILDDAYNSDLVYDVTDMRGDILAFAANSTNQSEYCIKLVNKMQFKSKNVSVDIVVDDAPIVFYDVEVFPNLFIVNWKREGADEKIVRMINPTPNMIEQLMGFRLIGFNCRRYDNHILYAALMGYTNIQLYNLSQKIINNDKNCYFGEAYNISYTDIYDFASAGNKKSLKKLEIEMGIHHQELGLPWDEPVPEELWIKVAEYCDNDVIATEAAFNYLSGDWTARQILADLADMSVNDTTNTLSTKIIFGGDRKPQKYFNYRDLSKPVLELDDETYKFIENTAPEMMSTYFGEHKSLLPYFPGYKYENGKSTYRGEDVGEGGWVYAEPGLYGNVGLFDVNSMHPSSVILECLFGIEFTTRFKEIVDGRVSIKHEAWDEVNNMLDGKLTPYIQKVLDGEMTSKQLADALKTAINSVYGLSSAKFDNPFRDTRNKDNIVAKRGALFMIDLKNAVQEQGYTVVHVKTDSIKVADTTPEIAQFIYDFGKLYGYTFEHEDTYDKMCLVNNAVYIAKYKYGKKAGKWTATGTQFQVPYVFKKLFSKEPIEFNDLCETKSVTAGLLYLDMNENLPDVSGYEKEFKNLNKKYPDKDGEYSFDFQEVADRLENEISKGHDYHFIGKVGLFCPIKDGKGGGVLYRKQNDKYYAVTGTTGYRWLESEMVETLNKSDDIDISYYDKLVDEAVDSISKYGDFEWLVSDDEYVKSIDIPTWVPPCGDSKISLCQECEYCNEISVCTVDEDTKTLNNNSIKQAFECKRGYNISE